MPVPQAASHNLIERGGEAMEEMSKTLQVGNTTIIIHSDLVFLSPEEQQEWFRQEWEKGNPVVRNIVHAILDCTRG